MSTLVIKNLSDELHARLKEQAQRNHRSVTKEVVQLIENGLSTRSPPPLPDPIRMRSGRMITIEEIEDAINEGRD